MQRNTTIALGTALLAGAALAALPADAVTIVPDCARAVGQEAPGLECVMETFRNVARLILSVTGSAALLMFVWGGFTYVTSRGNDKKIGSAKTIIQNAAIGIVLVMISGYVIEYVTTRLTTGARTAEIGQSCNDGHGRYESKNGVLTCVTQCANMTSLGYSCVQPGPGKECTGEFIGCGGGTQCCRTAQ